MEPERTRSLITALIRYREQLVLMDRQEELGSVDEEIALLESGHGRLEARREAHGVR